MTLFSLHAETLAVRDALKWQRNGPPRRWVRLPHTLAPFGLVGKKIGPSLSCANLDQRRPLQPAQSHVAKGSLEAGKETALVREPHHQDLHTGASHVMLNLHVAISYLAARGVQKWCHGTSRRVGRVS